MPQIKIDKEYRKNLRDTKNMIAMAEKQDCNEAETRRRIERMFETLMGYDPFRHLSRERAVRGAGETEHVDFSIELGEGEDKKPVIMIEIKRVCIDLAPKHLKQVTSYAIDTGCEWILLTNSKQWNLYHISYGQPPKTSLVHSWNVLDDDIETLAEKFELISFKSVSKGVLDDLWQKRNVLLPQHLIEAILSPDALITIRRVVKHKSGVAVEPEDIISGFRHLLNEASINAMDEANIRLPQKKDKKPRAKKSTGSESKNLSDKNEALAVSVDTSIHTTGIEAQPKIVCQPEILEASENAI